MRFFCTLSLFFHYPIFMLLVCNNVKNVIKSVYKDQATMLNGARKETIKIGRAHV